MNMTYYKHLSLEITLLLCGIIFYFLFSIAPANETSVSSAAITQLFIFIYYFCILGKKAGTFFSSYAVFLIVFYLFQNGQVLLYALNIPFDTFYVDKYSSRILLDSVIFSTLCLISAFGASIFSLNKSPNDIIQKNGNQLNPKNVLAVSKKGFFFLGIVALPLMFVKFYICATTGYFMMIKFAETVPSILKMIEKLFLAFSVLSLVYSDRKSRWYKIITIIILIWSLLAVFSGDRTVGLAGIAMLLLYRSNTNGVKLSFIKRVKKYTFFIFVGLGILYLINIAFSFRMQEQVETHSVYDTVIDAISQLGFSFFPLVLMMDVCPSVHSFQYGKTFIGGLVYGLIPSNIDFFGITETFEEWSSGPTSWIDQDFNYNFGIDFSLIAECWVNFGWYGWIAMFFLCVVIAKLLRNVDFMNKDNKFSQYTSLILMYSWFTLPRRKSYFIFNNWFWYILVVAILLLIFCRKRKNASSYE